MPELMEVIVMKEGMDLPEPDVPYYILAKENLYLHKKTSIGNVMVPDKTLPYTVGSIGEYKTGVFTWQGDPIPGKIIGQATSFFRRIYDKHQTEAEVLIVKHNETHEYRLFVPFQRVSPTGVKSVFEPTHIHRDWSIVGTLHSHCMMSAFHSGTDSHDASSMDGVHFTIGMVKNETPQIVAMVAMNKKEFHYPLADIPEVAIIDFNGYIAPDWWDNYVYPADSPSAKPKSLKSITQAMWDEFKGIYKPKVVTPVNHWANNGYKPHWSEDDRGDFAWGMRAYSPPVPNIRAIAQMSNESARFNAKQDKRQRKEDRQRARGRKIERKVFEKPGPEDTDWMKISLALDVAEDTGVFTDADWKGFTPTEIDEIIEWQKFFAQRLADVADVLDTLGMSVEFNVRTKATTKQLPGQTEMADYIGGAL